jgi:hypothetical protein
VLPPLYLLATSWAPGRSRAWRATAAAAALAVLVAATALAQRALPVRHLPAWTPTAIWDLAAVSVARGEVLLPEGIHGPGLDVAQLERALSPDQALPLFTQTRAGIGAGILSPMRDLDRGELLHRWLALPFEEPRAYFTHRSAVAWSLFGPQREDKPLALFMVPEVVRYADNPPIASNQTALNAGLVAAMQRWRTGPLAMPLAYLALGLLAALRLRGRAGTACAGLSGALLLSALLYAAPLPFIVPSAEWRYVFWPMFACALAALLALAAPRAPEVAESAAPAPPPRPVP